MATTPEGKVKAAIKKVLKKYEVWYYMPVQNGLGVVGIPDFIGCHNGRFIAIEAKAPGKLSTLTPNQARVQAAISRNGGVAITVDNAEVVEQILKQMLDDGNPSFGIPYQGATV